MGNQASTTGSRGPSPGGSPRAGGLRISVVDPVKTEGINGFVVYKVVTTGGGSQGRTGVARRYRDFEWLHTKLASSLPGCIIPPLPRKTLLKTFDAGFIEARRRALEKFLTRVSAHPDLLRSKHLTMFLQASDLQAAIEKESLRLASNSASKAGAGNDDLVLPLNHKVDASRLPTESVYYEIGTHISSLEGHFWYLEREIGTLLRKKRELATANFEFGLAITLLGQKEFGGLGDSLKLFGHTADRVSVISQSLADQEEVHLEEPFLEYCRMVTAVKDALQKRHEAKVAYHHALLELEHRKAASEKTRSAASFHAAARAETTASTAKVEFDVVCDRFLRDFERFKSEKGSEMKRIIGEYIQLQIQYHKKMKDTWSDNMRKLGNVDVDDGRGVFERLEAKSQSDRERGLTSDDEAD